jgi:hypothetical protein
MKRLWSLLVSLSAAITVVAVACGVFVGLFGFDRLKLDFWPLDSSRVGPNLVASMVMVVILVAHNEFVTERRAEARHETHKQLMHDILGQVEHPTEEVEQEIADAEEAKWKADVLDRLDPTTPGGIAAITALLQK